MPTVLVTGASRGIGRATAVRLATRGWDVLAGVRSDADAAALRAQHGRISPLLLDVTSAADVAALAGAVDGGLDAVVNNAGYVVDGPVEALDLDALRRQLEVNVVGQVAVTQAVLPALRRSQGRVVFISSLSGRIATPMTGAYNASKFALEALADAMRVELRPWRVPVVLIEPGPTATDLWGNAEAQYDATVAGMSPEHRQLYAAHLDGGRRVIAFARRMAVPVDRVVDRVEQSLTDRRPRARYTVDLASRAQLAGRAVTPTRVWDATLARLTGAR